MADLSGTGEAINAPGEVKGVKRNADGNISSIDSLSMGPSTPASKDASTVAGQGGQNAKQSDAQTLAKTPDQLGIGLTDDQKMAIQGHVGNIAKSQAELEEKQNLLAIQRQGLSQTQSQLQDARRQLPDGMDLEHLYDFVKEANSNDSMAVSFNKTLLQIQGERRPSADDLALVSRVHQGEDTLGKVADMNQNLDQVNQKIQMTDAQLQGLQTIPQQDAAQVAKGLEAKYVRENATKKIASLRRDATTVAQQERQAASQEKAVAKMGTPEYSKATEDVDTLGALEDRKSKYDAALGTLGNRARAKVGMDPSLGDATALSNEEQEKRAALRKQFGLGDSDALDAKKYDQLRADLITVAKSNIGTAEKTKQKNAILGQIKELEGVAGVSADQGAQAVGDDRDSIIKRYAEDRGVSLEEAAKRYDKSQGSK